MSTVLENSYEINGFTFPRISMRKSIKLTSLLTKIVSKVRIEIENLGELKESELINAFRSAITSCYDDVELIEEIICLILGIDTDKLEELEAGDEALILDALFEHPDVKKAFEKAKGAKNIGGKLKAFLPSK